MIWIAVEQCDTMHKPCRSSTNYGKRAKAHKIVHRLIASVFITSFKPWYRTNGIIDDIRPHIHSTYSLSLTFSWLLSSSLHLSFPTECTLTFTPWPRHTHTHTLGHRFNEKFIKLQNNICIIIIIDSHQSTDKWTTCIRNIFPLAAANKFRSVICDAKQQNWCMASTCTRFRHQQNQRKGNEKPKQSAVMKVNAIFLYCHRLTGCLCHGGWYTNTGHYYRLDYRFWECAEKILERKKNLKKKELGKNRCQNWLNESKCR